MKLLLINGSPAKKSHTFGALTKLAELAQADGHEVYLWDLREEVLPITMPEYHRNPLLTPDDNVVKFNKKVTWADAFILGTPLYHGSYSGVLKNALDNLAYDELRDKPVGLVSNGAGPAKSSQPNLHLVTVVQTLFGIPAQTQIGLCLDDYKELESGYELTNKFMIDRCSRLIEELDKLSGYLKFKSSKN